MYLIVNTYEMSKVKLGRNDWKNGRIVLENLSTEIM
jgi:hypothetical protein